MGQETNNVGAMHGLRVEIDRLIQYTAKLKESEDMKQGVRELSLVYTKLQEAKMWAGKVLEQLGSELPVEFRDKA